MQGLATERLDGSGVRAEEPAAAASLPPIGGFAQALSGNLLASRLLVRPDGKMPPVTHAVVLIKAERAALRDLGGRLAELDGVAEAYSVTGEWDFVAILRVPRTEDLAGVVTERLATLDGIERTYTMVAFEAYSRHDLEAMFEIGD
jgi:DNA-binding Lrp family transcriptional regulator